MPDLQLCPTDDTLRSVLLGSHAGPDADAVGDHVLGCPACGAKAEKLVASDPLLADLRAANDTSELGTDGTFVEELLRRVKNLGRKPAPNADLAFLAPPERPGDLGTLDRYRVVELLGQGGMGMVFRAIDPTLRRTVALKIILPKYADNVRLRERFIEEAQATARVRSAHVAEVYDCGVWRDVSYQTMELLTGQTLDKRPRPMPTDIWRRIAYGIAKGLSDAHRVGLVHRDLKPSNIHLGTDARTGKPTVKIIDFGLARPVNREIEVTKSGELLGTPAYMSPEQARGKKVDHRTDLYSLGVILHQLATGKLPYLNASEGVFAILTELATPDPLPSVTNLATNLPPILASLIDRLLAKDPANRPASADEVMAILKESLKTEKLPASTEVVASAPYVSIGDTGSVAEQRSIPFGDQPTAPLTATTKEVPRKRRPAWLLPAVGLGVLAIGLLIASAAGLFVKVKTPNGTIELTDLDPDAEVLVDGNVVTVSWDAGTEKAEITIPAGTRKVEVRKKGFVTVGEEVTVLDHERTEFVARLFEEEKDAPAPPKAAGPAAAAVEPSEELVVNGQCDSSGLQGWTNVKGKWQRKVAKADPFFYAGKCAEGILQQDIDVSKYAADIDAGRVEFKMSALLGSYGGKGQKDKAQFRVTFLDKDKLQLATAYDTGPRYEPGTWKEYGATRAPMAGTRYVRVVLRAVRSNSPGNEENSGYFDTVSVKALVQKPAAQPPDRKATMIKGTASREGDELVLHPGDRPGYGTVGFGDVVWRDYDVTVEVKGSGHVFFRATDRSNFWVFGANHDKGTHTCWASIVTDGTRDSFLNGSSVSNQTNAWNRLKVSARGSNVFCYWNDREVVRRTDPRHPAGRVALGAFQAEARFRNLVVTAPDGTKLFEGFPDLAAAAPPPRTETRVLGGQWRQAADRLFLARDAAMYFPQVAFGDTAWTDYDFTVQARRVLPTAHQFGLCFRSNGAENQNVFSLGAFGNTLYQAEENKAAKWNQMQTRKAALKLNVWYTATVKVRGNTFECLLAEGDAPAETVFRGTTSHPRGQVGLVLFKTGGYLFRDIKVTAPTGDVLWDGLPDVEKVAELPANLAASEPPPASPAFTPLFNGKDLAGWSVEGGRADQWAVADGAVTASAANPRAASFLLSDKDYGDFTLRFDYQIRDAGAVGGVALRAVPAESLPVGNKLMADHPLLTLTFPRAGDVTGSAWWMTKATGVFAPPVKTPKVVVGQWHTCEVTVRGDACAATFDGEACVDLKLDPSAPRPFDAKPGLMRAKGRVGFKVYTGRVAYRNVSIRELGVAALPPPPTTAFAPLFNGKDLTGWEKFGFPKGSWLVEDGVLVGKCPANTANDGSNLVTLKKDYRHFHLKLQAMKPAADTRRYTSRVVLLPGPKDDGVNGYFRVSLGSPDDAERREVGRLARGKGDPLPLLATPKLAAGAWYTLEVIVRGNRVRVLVDGVTTADVTDDAMPADGHPINVTCAQDGEVRVRSVEVRELEPPVRDYDRLGGGSWRPVLQDPATRELRNAAFTAAGIEIANGHAYDKAVSAADLVVRAQVKKQKGQTVMLTVRDVKGVYYTGFYECDDAESFGIGTRDARFRYGVKKRFAAATGVKEGEFFELACSAVGDALAVYANGTRVGEIRDAAITQAGGVGAHTTRGQGVFKNVEVMVVPKPAPTK